MQPVGGMDRIWQQLLLQSIEPSAINERFLTNDKKAEFEDRDTNPNLKAIAGKRFVGDLVYLDTPVGRIFSRGFGPTDKPGVLLKNSLGGQADGVDGVVDIDGLIVTAAPNLMGSSDIVKFSKPNDIKGAQDPEIDISDLKIETDFPNELRNALSKVDMTPAIKVGFQSTKAAGRFWEKDNQIFGGISWTTALSSQIWYPCEDFTAPTGVLTAAYNRGYYGWVFGESDKQERIQLAVEGGETLHPGYGGKVIQDYGMTIAWHYMPYQVAGWAAETYESQCEIYKQITTLPVYDPAFNPEMVLFAGDTYSETPGWQEGAVDSAYLAVKAIKEGLTSTDPALYGGQPVMECE